MKMGLWTWPLLGIIIIIGAIGFYTTRRIMVFERKREQTNDSPIPVAVKDHPYSLNPIIWVYFAALVFIAILIGYYYATSSSY
jgi:Trk-type K+ transport system membrane component